MKYKLIKILCVGLVIGFLSIFPFAFTNISAHSSISGTNLSSKVPKSGDLPPLANTSFTWGGTEHDSAKGIAIDSSNNVYIVGESYSYGVDGDVFLTKYNSVGVQLWNITWGGSGEDNGNRIALDSNGNIYITGKTNSFGAGDYDAFLVKFNSAGVQQWNVTWGGSGHEDSRAIAINSANNIYISGFTNSFGAGDYDAFVAEYNSFGSLLWNTTWGGQYKDEAGAIVIDSSNNVYISGCTYSFGTSVGSTDDTFLVKYNPSDIQQWNTTWGGSGYEGSRDMATDSSGNIYITTESNSFSVNYESLLVKFNSTGAEQWYRSFTGPDGGIGYGVTIDSMNDIYMVGGIEDYSAGGEDVFVAEYDDAGLQLWSATWGGIYGEFAHDIAISSTNNIYIVGRTGSFGAGGIDAFLLIYYNLSILSYISPNPNPDGNILLNWTPLMDSTFYNVYRSNTIITDISQLSPIATVYSTDYSDRGLNDGNYYYVVATLSTTGELTSSNCKNATVSLLSSPIFAQISPNPTNNSNITLNWNSVHNASSYKIYRSDHIIISTIGLTPIATISSTDYTDTNISNGTYYYAITAVNHIVESDLSNIESVTIIHPTVPHSPFQNIPGFPTDILIIFSVLATVAVIFRQTKNGTFKVEGRK